MSLVLNKWLGGKWEDAREYLRQDLDTIQTYVNLQLSRLVDTQGNLQTTIIQQTISGASLVLPLGGSDRNRVPDLTANVYADVLDYVPYYATSTFQVRVRVWGWTLNRSPDNAARVTIALYNETDGVRVASLPLLATSRSGGMTTFRASIVSGMVYRLQVACDTANVWPYAIGQMEAV